MFLLTLHFLFFHAVIGTTEFCIPGNSSVVLRILPEDCPFGVLFNSPVEAPCFISNEGNASDFLADVCRNVKFNTNSSQIQLITQIDGAELEDSCQGEEATQCNVDKIVEINSKILTHPLEFDDPMLQALQESLEADYDSYEEPDENQDILEQTRRMFKFLMGLRQNEEQLHNFISQIRVKRSLENNPHALRLTSILEQSFRILRKHCDKRFVPFDFSLNVEAGFYFILQETLLPEVGDLTEKEFDDIEYHLETCLAQNISFRFNGTRCRMKSKVEFIKKGEHDWRAHNRSDAGIAEEFRLGAMDVIVEGVWDTITFVHGLCYGTFSPLVNAHHLYQRAMESLFTKGILHRWRHPPLLWDDGLWENILSTGSVKHTMRNLEACVSAAYLDTPFEHTLQRPLTHYQDLRSDGGKSKNKGKDVTTTPLPIEEEGISNARRRRQTKAANSRKKIMTIKKRGDLEEAGWCFTTAEERKKGVMRYISVKCVNKAILKNKAYKKTLHWLAV